MNTDLKIVTRFTVASDAGIGALMIWINEYIGDPVIEYFEKMNFKRAAGPSNHFELPLPSVYLIKEK